MADQRHTDFARQAISFTEQVGGRVCAAAAKSTAAGKALMNSLKRTSKTENTQQKTEKKKKLTVAAVADMVFPAACVAALIFTVKGANLEYGVSVSYDGEDIGVVTGSGEISEAVQQVADKVKNYDTTEDYYVNTELEITPIASKNDTVDSSTLAQRMETALSVQFDEKLPELEESAEAPVEGEKVKAYAVRVDGEFIGAVTDCSEVETALEGYLSNYEEEGVVATSFVRDIEYDLEEYVEPDEVVTTDVVLRKLLGRVHSTDYYEVQDGDYLLKIADEKGMSLDQLENCYATYNGKPIVLKGDNLKTGTMIRFDTTVPYLEVECDKQVDTVSEIPFSTVIVEDSTLRAGERITETEGVNGSKVTSSVVTYRGDTVVKTRTLDTVVYERPVSAVIRVGTMEESKEGTINYNVPKFKEGEGSGEYIWPVDGGYISAHQGDGRGHKGIDIAAPYGTPIYAAAAGTVTKAENGWNGGYGNMVMIENDDGNVTVYAHQSELACAEGDVVEEGQLIGYIGSTGDSTGNHLHFEVRSEGSYLNPEEFVLSDEETSEEDTEAEE